MVNVSTWRVPFVASAIQGIVWAWMESTAWTSTNVFRLLASTELAPTHPVAFGVTAMVDLTWVPTAVPAWISARTSAISSTKTVNA